MGVVSEGGESIDMDTEEDASHTTEPLEVMYICIWLNLIYNSLYITFIFLYIPF